MNEQDPAIVNQAPRTVAMYFLALGLFALAGAIVYFSVIVAAYREEIPKILQMVDSTAEDVGPILDEVAAVRKQIPAVLDEVAEVRRQIPAILAEVEQTRKQIPPVLEEVAATRRALPQVASIVDNSATMVDQAVAESAAIRQLTPQVLDEVKATREAIPPTLERVDVLMGKASELGREASSGAVTGFFKGIITAPFVIVGNVGQSVFGMSRAEAEEMPEEDMVTLTNISDEVLSMTSVGASRSWENKATQFSGKVTLVAIDEGASKDCRRIRVQVSKKGREKFDRYLSVCRNDDGLWERVSD